MVTPLTIVAAVDAGSVTRIEVPNGSATSGKLVYFASSSDSVPPMDKRSVARQSSSISTPFAFALAALKMVEIVASPIGT